jgi:hypothetical protein
MPNTPNIGSNPARIEGFVGPLPVWKGGTGVDNIPLDYVLIGRETGPLASISLNELASKLSPFLPDSNDLRASDIRSGILPVARGGTGLGPSNLNSTYWLRSTADGKGIEYAQLPESQAGTGPSNGSGGNGGFSPTAAGQILYSPDDETFVTLNIGTEGQILTATGSPLLPSWEDPLVPNPTTEGQIIYTLDGSTYTLLNPGGNLNVLTLAGSPLRPVWSAPQFNVPTPTATGQIIYSIGGEWQLLARGEEDEYLGMNLGGTVPEWKTPALVPNEMNANRWFRSVAGSTNPAVWSTWSLPNANPPATGRFLRATDADQVGWSLWSLPQDIGISPSVLATVNDNVNWVSLSSLLDDTYARRNSPNNFTQSQIISHNNSPGPLLETRRSASSSTPATRIGMFELGATQEGVISQNARRTTTGWFVDDTNQNGVVIRLNGAGAALEVYHVASGSGSRPTTKILELDRDGTLWAETFRKFS